MTYSFLNHLSESRIFPSTKEVATYSRAELSELTYLYVCAIRILLAEEDSASWVRGYIRRTTRAGNFTSWRTDATDLYVLIREISGTDDSRVSNMFKQLLLRWLRDATNDHGDHEAHVRRLFVRLDHDLGIKDGSMRAIRRLVMDWPTLTEREARLAMTRLLQMLRARAPKAEALPFLNRVARLRNLELKDVCDLETGEGCDVDTQGHQKKSVLGRVAHAAAGSLGFIAGLSASRRLGENATSGSTSSASIATVAGALGVGFDPNGDTGIYPKPKSKPQVIKRQ